MNDWLDIPAAVRKTVDQDKLLQKALNEGDRSVDRMPVVPAGVDPDYAEAIKILRTMRLNQRAYIKALLLSGGRRVMALRMLREDMLLTIDPSTVSRWHKNTKFVRCVELVKKLLLKTSDLDPVSLQLRAGEVIDDAMTRQPVFDRQGNVAGYSIDHNAAMRGIEWLGKVHRMTDEDKAARVTLEFVNIADRGETIDVTPEK